MSSEEDTEVEEYGHPGSGASSVLGVDGRGSVDHGEGSRESVEGGKDEDDDEGGNVGVDEGFSEGHDEEDDEGEEDGLERAEDPVPSAGYGNDDLSVRSHLSEEAGQGAAHKVSNLESTNEESSDPSVLQGLVLRQDVEEESGEDGQADEEHPEDVSGLSPELREQGDEGSFALDGRVQKQRRVVVVDG